MRNAHIVAPVVLNSEGAKIPGHVVFAGSKVKCRAVRKRLKGYGITVTVWYSPELGKMWREFQNKACVGV